MAHVGAKILGLLYEAMVATSYILRYGAFQGPGKEGPAQYRDNVRCRMPLRSVTAELGLLSDCFDAPELSRKQAVLPWDELSKKEWAYRQMGNMLRTEPCPPLTSAGDWVTT